MASSKVAADWAWISRDSGVTAGILAASGRADLGDFVAGYPVGTPRPEDVPGVPEAPPWVTFAPFAAGELASISVRDPWQEQDHSHRGIWPRRFFLLRFADVAAANASYQTLWRSVERESLPPAGITSPPHPMPPEAARGDQASPGGRALLKLSVPEQSLGELAAVVEPEFEVIARLAVAVLEGRVAINALHLQRDRRLMLLDLVAALLPYGYRADLSVSSSVNNTILHGIRVVFADFANDQELVTPASAPEPRTRLGGAYLAMLREKASAPGLAALIRHLWAHKRPCSFERPGDALEALEDLDRGATVERALDESRATRDQVIGLLRRPAPADQAPSARDMPDELRERALSLVVGRLDADAAEVVVAHWRAMADDVQRLIFRRLDDGDITLAAWCLAEVSPALSDDAEDQLLAHLLVPRRVATNRVKQRRSALVELLWRREVPARGTFPATCAVVRYGPSDGWQARLVRELLAREMTADQSLRRAQAWVAWLSMSRAGVQRDLPDWVAALGYVLGGRDGQRPPAGFRPLLLDGAWAVTILRLARAAGRLPGVLERAAPTLVDVALGITVLPTPRSVPPVSQQAQPADGDRKAILRALDTSLWQQAITPGTVAAIDVVRLLLGGPPRDMPHDQPAAALDQYGFGLTEVLKYEAVRPWRDLLQREILVAALAGGSPSGIAVWLLNTWCADPEMESGLLRHLASLPADELPYSERLGPSFVAALAQHPGLTAYAAAPRIMGATRAAIKNPAALRRTLTNTGLSATELALACDAARRAGLPVKAIVNAMAAVIRPATEADGQAIEPGALLRVLQEFQGLSVLRHPVGHVPAGEPGGTEAAERDLLEFCQLIVEGAFGQDYGDQFARSLDGRLRDDIDVRKRMAKELPVRRRSAQAPRRRPWRGLLIPPSQPGKDDHAPRP